MKQKDCLEITTQLWNKWLEIDSEKKHPDDNNDFRFHIHALQNLLFANIYKNNMPLDEILDLGNKDKSMLTGINKIIDEYEKKILDIGIPSSLLNTSIDSYNDINNLFIDKLIRLVKRRNEIGSLFKINYK